MRRALALLMSAALCGCSLEPAYVRPEPAIPGTWPVGEAYPARTSSTAPLPSLSYREVFRDPHLEAIVAEALANAQDLRIALANVQIAHAQFAVQRAQLFPQVGVAGSATEAKGTASAGSGNTSRDYGLDLGFSSFELDLFGRLRSLSHAAQDEYLASEAGARAARLTLVGEVADAYLTLAADRSLLAVAQDTEVSAQKTVDLTGALLKGGVAPRTDLSLAQTVLDQARSDRAFLTTQVAQDRNALELLVGAPVPDGDLPASIESIDGLLSETPAGLDSRILLRRPDVLQAEYQLKAGNAQIGVARAAFFPTISLTALAGLASPALAGLFSGPSQTWQFGAAVAQPLFDGGARAGGLAEAKGQRDLALAQYQLTIQTAFREVADALARRGTIKDQLAAQTDLVNAATDSLDLGQARYHEGIDPYLTTLVAQRTLYSARQTLAAARLARATNLVALYQSLGGDQLIDDMAPPMPARLATGSERPVGDEGQGRERQADDREGPGARAEEQ